jgi:hypothetical protein
MKIINVVKYNSLSAVCERYMYCASVGNMEMLKIKSHRNECQERKSYI